MRNSYVFVIFISSLFGCATTRVDLSSARLHQHIRGEVEGGDTPVRPSYAFTSQGARRGGTEYCINRGIEMRNTARRYLNRDRAMFILGLAATGTGLVLSSVAAAMTDAETGRQQQLRRRFGYIGIGFTAGGSGMLAIRSGLDLDRIQSTLRQQAISAMTGGIQMSAARTREEMLAGWELCSTADEALGAAYRIDESERVVDRLLDIFRRTRGVAPENDLDIAPADEGAVAALRENAGAQIDRLRTLADQTCDGDDSECSAKKAAAQEAIDRIEDARRNLDSEVTADTVSELESAVDASQSLLE